MTPERLAELHALAFTDAARPWSHAEFTALVTDPAAVLAAHDAGFALGRVAGPEAELLTLAVDPAARRRGVARTLVADFETRAAARGAVEVFLEVAVTNTAARALYAGLGYAEVGRRNGYFRSPGAGAVDAMVLRRTLGPAGKID